MAKASGLGDHFYIGGYDLSGDVGALSAIAHRIAMMDTTAINKSARERIYALANGEISFNSFFNDAADQEHDALKGLLKTDRIAMWIKGKPATPAVAITSSSVANPSVITTTAAHGLTDGDLVYIVDHAGSTPAIDGYHTVTVTAGTTFTIPINVTVGGTGGTVLLIMSQGNQSASMEGKQINYDWSRTADMGLIATVQCLSSADADTAEAALQFTRTITAGKRYDTAATNGFGVDDSAASAYGLAAYLQVFAFTGTNVTVAFQESEDDAVADAYAAVTGGAFAAVAAAPAQEFIETGRALAVEQWLRIVTTGVFTEATFAVTYFRYED